MKEVIGFIIVIILVFVVVFVFIVFMSGFIG